MSLQLTCCLQYSLSNPSNECAVSVHHKIDAAWRGCQKRLLSVSAKVGNWAGLRDNRLWCDAVLSYTCQGHKVAVVHKVGVKGRRVGGNARGRLCLGTIWSQNCVLQPVNEHDPFLKSVLSKRNFCARRRFGILGKKEGDQLVFEPHLAPDVSQELRTCLQSDYNDRKEDRLLSSVYFCHFCKSVSHIFSFLVMSIGCWFCFEVTVSPQPADAERIEPNLPLDTICLIDHHRLGKVKCGTVRILLLLSTYEYVLPSVRSLC